MYIDLSNFPKKLFYNEDIIINDIRTYPLELVDFLVSKAYNEDDLPNYFYENRQYNVLGVHFTRLTNDEIQDITQTGYVAIAILIMKEKSKTCQRNLINTNLRLSNLRLRIGARIIMFILMLVTLNYILVTLSF